MTPTETNGDSFSENPLDTSALAGSESTLTDAHDAEDYDGTNDAAAPLPTVEDMEELILEAYNNMQSDGEHIFLPGDVASKLHYIAQLVKSAGYTSDDLVSNSSESNQEETSLPLMPPASASKEESAVASAPSSPPISRSLDEELRAHVSQFQLDDNNAPRVARDGGLEEHKPTEALTLDSNNFAVDRERFGEVEFEPALSPVQELSEDVMSISDFGSVTEPPPETLSPLPAKSPMPAKETVKEAPKSMLRKPEVHRKPSIPPRPSSTKSSKDSSSKPAAASRSNPSSSRANSDITPAPPLSRDRASSSYEQRREAAQKLKEEKAQRELQVRESARKQREDARRKLEEAQQKELAAKRERVARLKILKDQRKGPVKSSTTTR